LPFVLGQLLRPLLREQATRHKARLSQASSLLIAFMVFAAFSNSFANRLWQREEPTTVMLTLGLVLVLMAALHGGVFLLGRRALGADRQALLAPLVLCGSQKTLAAGLPMAQSLFAASALNLGLLLLPLLLYHPIQLLLGGVIANTFRRRINASAPPASAPAPGPMASTPATQR
jgi:sodium/bile acid cotransporter 7